LTHLRQSENQEARTPVLRKEHALTCTHSTIYTVYERETRQRVYRGTRLPPWPPCTARYTQDTMNKEEVLPVIRYAGVAHSPPEAG
jgi:hypothetical protein